MSVDDVEALASDLRAADSAAALSGAGVSTASGLPDFRGGDGLWRRFDPGDFHVQRFRDEPREVWQTLLELYDEALSMDPEPNAAHDALAVLEEDGYLDAVVTQNVDGLHQESGSEDVVELHGNMREAVCRTCGRTEPLEAVRDRFRDDSEQRKATACVACGRGLKPGGVLFGEPLPEDAYRRARELAEDSDVFIALGSSLTVEPAAGLAGLAADTGASVAVVNHDSTPYDDEAEYVLRRDVTEVLPAVAEELP